MNSLPHPNRDEKGRFLPGNAHATGGGHARARSLPAHRRSDIARRGYHKQGETIFIRQQHHRRPVIVIGDDERGVIVDFGEMRFILSSPAGSNGRVVIVRAESEHPIESRGAEDIQNQVEYHQKEATAPPG